MAIKRNSEGKIIPKRFSLRKIEACAADYVGLCRACGAEKDGCEPDARKYECDSCGLNQVYGAEECALMGWVK